MTVLWTLIIMYLGEPFTIKLWPTSYPHSSGLITLAHIRPYKIEMNHCKRFFSLTQVTKFGMMRTWTHYWQFRQSFKLYKFLFLTFIYSNYATKNSMYKIVKTLNPGGFRTHDLLFHWRRRWTLHCAALCTSTWKGHGFIEGDLHCACV
jgi:hypothetical protein